MGIATWIKRPVKASVIGWRCNVITTNAKPIWRKEEKSRHIRLIRQENTLTNSNRLASCGALLHLLLGGIVDTSNWWSIVSNMVIAKFLLQMIWIGHSHIGCWHKDVSMHGSYVGKVESYGRTKKEARRYWVYMEHEHTCKLEENR